ncbi:DUF2336 domain-containing protein [Herbiconiux sp. CPCC 203407]|uniref:DUF2336 domain-containing protein n=1 Tax=Herbiconiux oxytropis TaxID=2970915 RepID=A0AA41XFD6_9MICO|nr:DUF2336 domain-containing protein [Herbiconiux oxytropis]MCS5724075.1 DUF2336 domain-containing protein [Herbiconiux oxytropis]MCS5726992.1 DUF2336 domain-containing protein [Herbiconiux oxytropis]
MNAEKTTPITPDASPRTHTVSTQFYESAEPADTAKGMDTQAPGVPEGGSDLWVASHGEPHSRSLLAQREDLAPEVLAVLVHDPDPAVVAQLALNPLLSRAQIEDITARHPHLRHIFAHSASAPARHKGELPIIHVSAPNFYLFVQEVKATVPEIRALQEINREATRMRNKREPPLLWDAWMSVHSPSPFRPETR